ncbi:uncharacterized protein LOC111434926 [Cucurbita moschata]|uniref:Uncharacterized protein LOC111434926 n=1 Tax=Cucurbita moschata TaxID=3662 RepID=A0A6J1EIR1_CUCMO|nr:uncharacterized protein LOC111434926 [Cucurbita moschata]
MGDSESIDEYLGKLTIIVNKLRGLGNVVDDIQVVKKLLRSTSAKFLQITSTIKEFSDLKTKLVDEIIGSLKAHEERLQGFGEKDETVLLTRAEWMGRENAKSSKKEGKDQESSRGGRGQGRGRWRGRGRKCSIKDEQLNLIEMQKDEKSSLLMIEACEIKTTRDKEPDFVMLNETIVPPPTNIGVENSWYLDTRVSNHMSGERRVFRELDISIVGKIHFDDNSVIDICGRGIVLFKCKIDEHLILSQVYYIPKLKSNIISLGQLDESENKIVIEDCVMKIYDRPEA